jgi:hypothetical protein
MSKYANKEQITVTEAEATLSRFEAERLGVVERKTALADKRRQIAFDALSGDKSASKLLDGLHREAVELESRVVSVNDAIAEAQRRLEQARQREQKEANKQRALQVRQVLAELVEGLGLCGKALDLFVGGANKADAALEALHRLGCAYPSRDQVRVYGALAIHTALMQSALWAREVGRHLAPNERKTFDELKVQWHDMVERNAVAPYLDDDEQINEQIKTATEAA